MHSQVDPIRPAMGMKSWVGGRRVHIRNALWPPGILGVASGLAPPDRGDNPGYGPRTKRRPGAWLDSAATAGRAPQNLLCACLAVAVLAGLLANTLLGWWWLDPVVALGIAGPAVREGVEAWHGEECC